MTNTVRPAGAATLNSSPATCSCCPVLLMSSSSMAAEARCAIIWRRMHLSDVQMPARGGFRRALSFGCSSRLNNWHSRRSPHRQRAVQNVLTGAQETRLCAQDRTAAAGTLA